MFHLFTTFFHVTLLTSLVTPEYPKKYSMHLVVPLHPSVLIPLTYPQLSKLNSWNILTNELSKSPSDFH